MSHGLPENSPTPTMPAGHEPKSFSDKPLNKPLNKSLTDTPIGGTKLDTGKLRHDLLPPDALNEVARVFTFGAEKYAARNWEQGMDWGRVYAAQQRHMLAFWGGEMYDPETGMLHTAHATFGTLVLTAYSLRGSGADTRFNHGAQGVRYSTLAKP